MNNEIDVLCPKCSKTTNGHLSSAVCSCGQELTFNGKPAKYIKKPWIAISTTVAFLSGVAGTVGGEYYLLKENLSDKKVLQESQSNRYSINEEYLIINSCISQDNRPLRHSDLMMKKEICICALEKTQHEYDYLSYKNNKSLFLSVFEKQANECMNMGASAASAATEAYPY